MKTYQNNKNAGFAPIGVVVVLLVVSIGGYLVFSNDVAVRRQTTPTLTMSLVPPQNYNINPDALYPSRSVVPTPIPSGQSGAYGRVIISYTMGPTATTYPYVGTMIVKIRSTNSEYTRFQTDAQGNYRVTLPANTYYFIPADGAWPWATNPKYARDIVVRGGIVIRADLTLIANTAQ